MAYYYVKSGGTATGDGGRYASAKTATDNWATAFSATSEYYGKLDDIDSATTKPVAGDVICCSDASTAGSYTGDITIGTGWTSPYTTVIAEPIYIICVDDDNVGQASTGFKETNTTGWFSFVTNHYVYGISMTAAEEHYLSAVGSIQTWEGCTFETTSSTRRLLLLSSDGNRTTFIDSTFIRSGSGGTGSGFSFTGSGSWAEFINCSFQIDDGSELFLPGPEGVTVRFIGCDMTGSPTDYLIGDLLTSSTADDQAWMEFRNCKFPSYTGWVEAPLVSPSHELLVVGCGASSGEQEYQYLYMNGMGQIEDNTAVYRDASQPWPSGQKTSLRCDTVANISAGQPFRFEMPARYAKLSSTASDTVRIHFTCANALDDGDVWAEVVYQDGTNTHTPNYKASVTNGGNPLRTAGSLSADTGSWTGELTNKYYIDLDTSTDAGADCYPIVRVYVAKASETIYFDSEVEIRG